MTRAPGWYYLPRADEDVKAITDHYGLTADRPELALRFVLRLEESLDQLVANPRLGEGARLGSWRLRGMRKRSIRAFRMYLIFYRERPEGIEVVRVVHGARDLAALFRTKPDSG